MKAEKAKNGILKRLAGTLTKNWGLKLLALILALVIYHSLKTNNGQARTDNDRRIFEHR